MKKYRILIVEDEAINALFLKRSLSDDYEITGITSTGEDAIEMALRQLPDCIIMDIKLEGPMSGIEAIARIRESFPVPHIYCTAYSDEPMISKARSTNPVAILFKPLVMEDLREAIRKVTG
jgi:CheY-like chemotaxis protein